MMPQNGIDMSGPFTPANAQNVLANGSLSTTHPLQLSNSPYNQSGMQSGSFGMQSSGGFGSMSPMSTHMSNSPGYPPSMNNMSNQMPMQNNMQPMPMQGGMSNAGMGEVLSRLSQMSVTMGQMHEQIIDQRNYIEQRDSWLETRMSQLERRCQKVEVLSDRLYTLMRGFDVADLAAVPKEISKALNRLENFSPPSSPASPTSPTTKALRDLSSSSDPALPPSTNASNDMSGALSLPSGAVGSPSKDGHHAHHGHHENSHKLEEHLKRISSQVEVLMSHAEATPQITRLLWRMDLNLRQLTGTATNLPGGQLPQQSLPQASDAPSGSNSHMPSKKRPTLTISNSRQSSRLTSKQRPPEGGGASSGGEGNV